MSIDPVAEHIRRVVDAAPPIADAQRAELAVLLLPPGQVGATQAWRAALTEREREQARERAARDAKAARVRAAAARILACAICGIPEVAHRLQGPLFHEWEPQEVGSAAPNDQADELSARRKAAR